MIVEYVTVFAEPNSHPERVYYLVLAIDAGLSVLLGLSGMGILRGRARSIDVASWTLVAGLVNCLGLLAGVWIPGMKEPFGLLLVAILAPRFLYYLVFLVSSPLLLRLLLRQPPGFSSRKWSLAGSVLVSALLVALVMLMRHAK